MHQSFGAASSLPSCVEGRKASAAGDEGKALEGLVSTPSCIATNSLCDVVGTNTFRGV